MGIGPESGASPSRLTVRAYAKINLALDLHGTRADGYTEISTIFQTVGTHDSVDLMLSAGRGTVRLETAGDEPCLPERNLAYLAGRLVLEAASASADLDIRLTKRIPAGAGLGGGSSDAAAVLKGANRLLGEPLSEAELAHLGARLGADVPFLLCGGTAIGRGIGDRLESLPDVPEWAVVLARKGGPLETAAVYGAARARLTPRADAPNIASFLASMREEPGELPVVGNALLPAAVMLSGSIEPLLTALRGTREGRAGMSGSGSAVFGIFRTPEAAEDAAERLRATARPDWLETTRIVSRVAARGLDTPDGSTGTETRGGAATWTSPTSECSRSTRRSSRPT